MNSVIAETQLTTTFCQIFYRLFTLWGTIALSKILFKTFSAADEQYSFNAQNI